MVMTLAALSLPAGICSCSSSGDIPDEENVREEILLEAGVPEVEQQIAGSTRGVVSGGAEFKAGICGWESAEAPVYAASPTWQTRFSAKALPQVADVALETRQTYNPSSSVKTYMKAWYPDGKLENGRVDFTLCKENLGNSTLDILLAREINGSKADRFGKALKFEHLTTQLIFKVKKGEGLAPATRINKIEIKNAKVPYALELANDKLISREATLSVPGIDGKIVIGTTAAGDKVGQPVMIEAPQGKSVTLRVTTSTAVFENVTVTIDKDANFLPGKAYEITLTFNQREVEIGASVTNWAGGTGSGTVI